MYENNTNLYSFQNEAISVLHIIDMHTVTSSKWIKELFYVSLFDKVTF